MRVIRTEICGYLENVCNSSLTEELSSYDQQLLVLVSLNPTGTIVIFLLPSSFVYNSENYYNLYDIISIAVWPEYTCLRPSSMQIATLEDRSLSTAGGFFFPWEKGHPKRLVGTVDDLVKQ